MSVDVDVYVGVMVAPIFSVYASASSLFTHAHAHAHADFISTTEVCVLAVELGSGFWLDK